MLNKGVLVATLVSLFSVNVNALTLKGHLTQGGLVIGQINNVVDVYLNNEPLKVTDKGEFVFGFARDAKSSHELSWRLADGAQKSQTLFITERDYNIDYIEGVEKKYVEPPKEVTARIKREAAAVKKARSEISPRTDFLNPVFQPAVGRISGVYGSQRVFNGKPRNPHFGLDIANKTGTPVYAPLPGKVVFANTDLYYSGGTLIIDHGFGVTTTYIHLSKLTAKVGDEVSTGDKIAEIGATGRVTGPHLDWRLNWQDVRLDPALLMRPELAQKQKK